MGSVLAILMPNLLLKMQVAEIAAQKKINMNCCADAMVPIRYKSTINCHMRCVIAPLWPVEKCLNRCKIIRI
jgi:hypothetical protein